MPRSLNIRGTTREIFQTSSGKSFPLGTRMHTPNGRVFRYSRASATDLSVGRCVQLAEAHEDLRSTAINANVIVSKDTVVDLVLGRELYIAIDEFEDGMLFIDSGDGEGHVYGVDTNDAYSNGPSTLRVYLDSPVNVTLLASSSKVSLIKNRYKDVQVTEPISAKRRPTVGITPTAVTASYYFWLQTDGPCAALQQGELRSELPISPSEITAGAVSLSRVVIPRIDLFSTNIPVGATGWAVIQSELNATDKEYLAPATGLAVVQSTPSIGYVINPAEDGQQCLVYLTLDN